MTPMRTITAQVQRTDRHWLVYVPEVGHHTQGRNLRDAKAMAIDLAATWFDVPTSGINLAEVTIELPDSTRNLIKEAKELRGVAEVAQQDAALAMRKAAAELKESGLSVRDIGESLGVSHQRAHQLVAPVDAATVAVRHAPGWHEYLEATFPSVEQALADVLAKRDS